MTQIKLYGHIHSRKRQIIRKEIYEKQNGKCYWCMKFLLCWHPRITKGIRASNFMEIDHIIPRCAGGSNDRTNLVGACSGCNIRRSKLWLKYYKFFVILDQESPIELSKRYHTALPTAKMNGVFNA